MLEVPEVPVDGPATVVVGVDGGTGAVAALRWAVRWCLRRAEAGARWRVVAVACHPTALSAAWEESPPPDPVAKLDGLRAAAAVALADGLAQVRLAEPRSAAVPVKVLVEPGPAGAVLVRASSRADLLVVGAGGRHLVGSVALHAVSAAACPVVVVPDGWAPRWPSSADDPDLYVVAGVDASPRSTVALARAVEVAGPHGWVSAVHAVPPVGGRRRCDRVLEQARVLAREQADLDARALLARGGRSTVVRGRVAVGDAGPVLVEQGAEADLLVVASRGRSEFRGLLLGSVALHCVRHARCPVLVEHCTGRSPSRARLHPVAAVELEGGR